MRSSARHSRQRSSVDAVLSNNRLQRLNGESGQVTSEKVARLCGDHLEHAYEALRLTTSGTSCVSCCYHASLPNTVVCSTSINSINCYDTAHGMLLSQQSKGPRRCSNAFNPSLSHVAVYGDPLAPAVELQLCACNKFAFLEGPTAEVRCCVVSEDGSIVVSGGREGQAFLWHITQPAGPASEPVIRRFSLPGHSKSSMVKACCVSADGLWAATGGNDGNVLLWDLAGLVPDADCNAADADGATAGDGDPLLAGQDSAAAAAAAAGKPAVAQPVQLSALLQLPKGEQVSCLDLSRDGSWLAVGSRSGKVYLLPQGSTELQQLPTRHQDGYKVRCCALSPDGSKLLSAAEDARLVLWDVASGSCVLSVHEHFKPVRGCCWSPDGRHIVTVGLDSLLCVLDVVLLSSQHRLRVPMRLNTALRSSRRPSQAAAAAGSAAADRAGSAAVAAAAILGTSCSSPRALSVPRHPLLQRTAVAEQGSRLLACAPVLQRQLRDSSGNSSSPLTRPGSEVGQQEAVLCADHAGKVSVLLPGDGVAAQTSISFGSGFTYCSFSNGFLAAARRDGAVTAISCNSAAAAAAASAVATATTSAVDLAATVTAPAAAACADAALCDAPVAVSAKMDMLVSSLSVNSQLGRVALVGTDKKQHQVGVLWLWEYDPSVRPAGITAAADEDELHATSDAYMGRRVSQGSVSSAESREPSIIATPRAGHSSDMGSDGRPSTTKPSGAPLGAAALTGVAGAAALSPAAAAIGPDGWLWHCENPFKVLTTPDTALSCCAWAGGVHARLVVGAAAGWLAVVNMEGEELEQSMTRYQIHTTEVTAVDFADDGSTVVSGALDGRVIVWSHLTGFKLAVVTLHTAAVRSVAFNTAATLLAIGDASGIISSWDVPQSCLITAAQAHDGPVSCVGWSRSGGSSSSFCSGSGDSSSSSLVACGYDGAVSLLQADHSIAKLYSAAFRGLYYNCKKNNKVHKLEAALNWHLQQGALQDGSVLQLLVMLAAADGNVAVLSLLLPLFEKMGWLLHVGPVFATPQPALPKSDSDKSLLSKRSYFPGQQPLQSAQSQQQAQLGFYAMGITEDYVIHPHDRQADASVLGALGSRRGTRDSMKQRQQQQQQALQSQLSSAAGGDELEGLVRNRRWANSVADLRTVMAFKPKQVPQQQQQRRTTGDAAAVAAPTAGSAAASPARQANNEPGDDSDPTTGGSAASSPMTRSPALTPSSMSPTRMLSPATSRNARAPAALDTLHEASHEEPQSPESPAKLAKLKSRKDAAKDAIAAAAAATMAAVSAAAATVSGTLSAPSSPRCDMSFGGHDDNSGGGMPLSRSSAPLSVSFAAQLAPSGSPLQRSSSGGGGGSDRAAGSGGGEGSWGGSAQLRLAALQQQQQSNGSFVGFSQQPDLQQLPSSPLKPASCEEQHQHPHPHQQQQLAEQQQRQLGPGVGRRLVSFLSGNRRVPSRAAGTAGGGGDGSSPDDSDTPIGISRNLRQRSLSDGASMAQRYNAYKAGGLLLSSPGGSGKEKDGASGDDSSGAGAAAAAASSNAAVLNAAAAQPTFAAVDAASAPVSSSALPAAVIGAPEDGGVLTPQPSRRRSTRELLLQYFPFGSSKRSLGNTSHCSFEASEHEAAAAAGGAGQPVGPGELLKVTSGLSNASLGKSAGSGMLGGSKRRYIFEWVSWRERSSKAGQQQPQSQPQLSMQPRKSTELVPAGGRVKAAHKTRSRKEDLLQLAMASQQAGCVRLVVDALLEGRFSKASVVAHMYEALQALIHDPQHKRACRRLLKHLPMIDLGEVEVDSLLTHNTKILYKCSAHGHPGSLWASATSGQQPLLDALDVLIKRASWRDSIVALLMWPALWGLRHVGAWWLWIWATQSLGARNRVQVSARSQLVPVARAAEIRSGSKGNLLRQLVSANVDADLYGKELVRAIINVKWESFARAFLLMQGVQFFAFLTFFLAYMGVAVYGNDPNWSTAELLAHPQGRAALVLELFLMIMMFGQAADELKQIVTYGRDYFNSPWNYMDMASCIIIAMLFLLHISRLNHQLFVVLVALEVLLLCLRSLYFCMALDQIGALLRMVLIVIRDMRYFFMMLLFLLISFGLTFSVLMSPASTSKVNIVSLMGSRQVALDEGQVFGSLEDSMMQLFTIMFGDVQFSTLKTIMNVNTVASRLAVILACVYALLLLIVLVNLLIAIVDETYGTVKESEADQMLRNKALIIDEIESTLTDAVVQDLNSRVLLPYVHILIPQAARADPFRRRDVHTKLRKLKHFIKERLPAEPAAIQPHPSLPSAGSDAAAFAAAAAGGSYYSHQVQQQQYQQLPGGPWSGPGQQQMRQGAPVASSATALPGQLGSWHGGSMQQQQQRGSNHGQAAAAGGSRASHDGGGSSAARAAEAAATAAAAAKIQQEIGQLSSSMASINQQLEAVAGSSTAAVAELAAKVDGLQGEMGQVKELLLALLAKQQ